MIAGGVTASWYLKGLAPRAKQRVVTALAQRFDADVDLQSLDLAFFPTPNVTGQGLSIRHRDWQDPHPIIYIRRFTARTDFSTLLDRRNHVDLVRLEGLEIHIPPRGRASQLEVQADHHQVASSEPGHDATSLKFLIETIVADSTVLEIEPKVEGKRPLRFDIQKLRLQSVAPGQPMTFAAQLTNAKPPGLIDSSGKFGPWQRDDPRATPVSGTYRFENANLAVFKGISGTLASTGSYNGVLQHIDVNGSTDTPNFALKRGGQPVHLMTRFHSVVNGTDGDTVLDPVEARFLQTEFLCEGGVMHVDGTPGKTVSLDATTKSARMEDILRLIIGDSKPFLTGAVDFKSKIVIPPGNADVLDKLQLNGEFGIRSARFTSPEVQRRLLTLSNRARGITKEDEAALAQQTVASNMNGRFKLDGGVISMSHLEFGVPGAAIDLVGDYNLRSQTIDFKGTFRMQATLADTQSGVKHWLLKPLDPLFEKDGSGFMIPIQISGTRDRPDIGATIFHHHFEIH